MIFQGSIWLFIQPKKCDKTRLWWCFCCQSVIMICRLQLVLSSVILQSTYAQVQHFFGPPAVGFGVGLLSIHRRFPVARQIVSRRASRSYSHQYHYQATPFGSHGYQSTVSTSRFLWDNRKSFALFSFSSYSTNDHYYASANLRYYQPNVYHYHSTPWHYRCLFIFFWKMFSFCFHALDGEDLLIL